MANRERLVEIFRKVLDTYESTKEVHFDERLIAKPEIIDAIDDFPEDMQDDIFRLITLLAASKGLHQIYSEKRSRFSAAGQEALIEILDSRFD